MEPVTYINDTGPLRPEDIPIPPNQPLVEAEVVVDEEHATGDDSVIAEKQYSPSYLLLEDPTEVSHAEVNPIDQLKHKLEEYQGSIQDNLLFHRELMTNMMDERKLSREMLQRHENALRAIAQLTEVYLKDKSRWEGMVASADERMAQFLKMIEQHSKLLEAQQSAMAEHTAATRENTLRLKGLSDAMDHKLSEISTFVTRGFSELKEHIERIETTLLASKTIQPARSTCIEPASDVDAAQNSATDAKSAVQPAEPPKLNYTPMPTRMPTDRFVDPAQSKPNAKQAPRVKRVPVNPTQPCAFKCAAEVQHTTAVCPMFHNLESRITRASELSLCHKCLQEVPGLTSGKDHHACAYANTVCKNCRGHEDVQDKYHHHTFCSRKGAPKESQKRTGGYDGRRGGKRKRATKNESG